MSFGPLLSSFAGTLPTAKMSLCRGTTSFKKEHLWMYLQTLGFEPGPATTACGKVVSHTHLGVNMFDKPNRDAFQIVSYFLFQTLDQSLTKEVFKFCWPPFDQKSETEFRKHCCEWLKKISAECGSSFPQVVGSLFLSPGGPKFIHLMYHFARFVAIKYIKTHSKDSSRRVAETFNVNPQDLHMCIARSHVARNRFLQILQREDFVFQKYQENAQLLDKEVRNLKSECIGLQNQIKKMEPYDDQSDIQEKIQKVRSLWASVNETLLFLEKEREIVSSVLSLVNQYTLDGTNVAINVPRLLLDKIEKQMCQLHIGNVYEAGKLNLLTVIQLLNEVLKVMKYECCQADQARLTIDLRFLEKETKFQKERLLDLKHMRHKLEEDLTTVTHSIVEKQGEWHKKWKEFLGLSPFSLIKGWTPAVDLLPPMSPLSFDPASEEVYARSILLQYPASLPDTPKQHNQENDCRRASDVLGTGCDLTNSSASFLLQPVSSSNGNNVTVFEEDMKMKTSREKTEAVSKKTPECEREDLPSSDIAANTESSAFGGPLPVKKIDPFQKEQDHLAEEVVKTVLSDSPQLSTGKEVKLEELIDSLVSNPFLTRNQIPRTPENLISDIRSSWRKAVEMEDKRTTESIQMDTEHREGLKDIDFGILHETLPEEVGHLSLNSSSSTEANFKLELNSPMHSSIFPEDAVGERQTTPKSDFSLPAIYSRYEALKKSLIKKKEETYLSNSEAPERHKPELNPTPQNMQTDDMLNLLDTQDLHTDYTKPSLHMSLGERKQSLSPLIKFSPVEQRLRTTMPCSLGELLPNLKEEGILNKSLDAKESPYDLKREFTYDAHFS
ncbi:HAUS augmin-like complex subunit 6 [Molossus molossus]|uniref:HAUS augmin like complex subunit 6 n=2 Tax=Molossus molossus TaxID=27622 RepID=A0A7J8EE63_MOLMO|nr:HAUS augmin-like complex subunit 6 [Molossus molossus]KAF6433565.1 HAUS augmin like complex subunit 6 [Molossus molossus]